MSEMGDAATDRGRPTRGPSNSVAVLAAALPLVFTLGSCGLSALALGGAEASMLSIREMGTAFYMVAMGTGVASLGVTILGFLSAKGARVPAAASVALASLPWVAGLVGTVMGMSVASDAIAFVDSSLASSIMAAGLAEASQSRVLGATISSGLFAAVAFGLAIGALNQRAAGRGGLIGAVVGLSALPLLGLALYAAAVVGLVAATLVVSALGAIIAVALAGAGAGDDPPHGRSGALAAAAAVAAGLSVVAAAVAGSTASLVSVFEGVARADAFSRTMLIGRGVYEMAPLRIVAVAAGPVALIAAVAVAAWAVARSGPSGRPTAGRLIGGAALMLVALLVVAGDHLAGAANVAIASEASTPPWESVEGFSPIALAWEADAEGERLDAVVTVQGLAALDGSPLAPFEAGALTAALRELSNARAEREPEVPEWLREGTGIGSSGDQDAPPTQLELAIDPRVDAVSLRALVEAAAAAGVQDILVHGIGGAGLDEDRRAMAHDADALLGTLADGRGSVLVTLGPTVSEADARADRRLLHTEVGAAPADRADGRAGVELTEEELSLTPPAGFQPRDAEERGRIFLRIGDASTADSVFRTAANAAARGHRPILVSGPIPGQPELPIDRQERTARLAGAEHGSLSREAIRSVVRRHINEVRYCYEQQLQRRPELAGRVVVSFIISSTGTVQSAFVSESTLSNASAEGCIAQAVRRWTFPAPTGGIVTVNYPFELSPTG